MRKLLILTFLISAALSAQVFRGTATTTALGNSGTAPFDSRTSNAIACFISVGFAPPTVADTAGDTFTQLTDFNSGGTTHDQWWVASISGGGNAANVVTTTTGNTVSGIQCFYFSGIASGTFWQDLTASAASGNNTTAVSASFTTSQATGVMLIGVATGSVGQTYSCCGGASLSGFTVTTDNGDHYTGSAYKLTSTIQTAQTAGLTLGTSSGWYAIPLFIKAVQPTTQDGASSNGIPNQQFKLATAPPISLTAQTAAVSTATLCSVTDCPAGQYRITAYLASTVVCATPGPAVAGIVLTWTDDSGTKTAQTVPLLDGGALTTPTTTVALGTTTGYGFGTLDVWTSGANPIQYATTYTACTTGTGTYSTRLTVEHLQ